MSVEKLLTQESTLNIHMENLLTRESKIKHSHGNLYYFSFLPFLTYDPDG